MDRARFAFVLSIAWGAAILAGIIAVYLTIVGPANAHPMLCGKWEQMRPAFEADGFSTTGMGVVDENRIATLMQTGDGDRWMIVIVAASDDSACITAMGEYWMQDAQPEAPVAGKRPA